MNTLFGLFCRTFQTGMRIALPVLPYRTPKIVSAIAQVPSVIRNAGCVKPIIVTDPQIYALGLTKGLEEAMRESQMEYVLYAETVPNPTTQTVADALQLYQSNGCDCIVGLGGGSSMDCAKALGARVVRPKKSLYQMKGILKVWKKLPPLIAIPTTAGTGSETTLAAVIVDAETRHKYAIEDFPLIPHYAVLDADLTLSLPPFITATTGMDALTHAVEAYIGRSTPKETREEALKAVNLIFENLDTAYTDGRNRQARENMLHASFWAGDAFSKSYVGYVHAVAHSLGGAYNVPHGLANSVLLPIVLEAYGDKINKKLHALAIAAGVATQSTPQAQAAAAFKQAIRDMKQRFGLGDTFPELKKEDIPRLAKLADREANPLYPVPVLMDAAQLEQFYYAVLED